MSLEEDKRSREAVGQFLERIPDMTKEEAENALWDILMSMQGQTFYTSKGLEFSYQIKRRRNGTLGGELLVTRKENSKTITKSSVFMAFWKALQVQQEMGYVKGPKALGGFGASYLYPIFLRLGLIQEAGYKNVSLFDLLDAEGSGKEKYGG